MKPSFLQADVVTLRSIGRETDAEVVRLRLLDMSFSEIGAVLGLTPENARRHLKLARWQLERELLLAKLKFRPDILNLELTAFIEARAAIVMKENGVVTLGDLHRTSSSRICLIPGIGRKFTEEMKALKARISNTLTSPGA